ncbi:leukemia inhibitory factor receptor [Electrophorus electricus]|uniref:leukemia inhibitory factor receptor n=1 Tax=Electrophorus electricus TaxID=8005 RepID=UPI0015CFF151|nr:leukemia inhibitory factor receptor [Electrophorus electricus]
MWLLCPVTVLFIISAGSGASPPTYVDVRARDTWNLEVRWTADGERRRGVQVYEIQIGRNENFTVVDQRNVSKEAPGAGVLFLTWVWTSALPLQCADHSVRIRCVFSSSLTSSWSAWTTAYGQQHSPSGQVQLFPVQQVLQEGTSTIFCCIPADGANVTAMKLGNVLYTLSPVGGRVQAIREERLDSSLFGVNLICQDDSGSKNIVLNYVTFPPQRPQNLSCETSDLRNIVCSWIAGRKPNLSNNHRRRYTLQFQRSDGVNVTDIPCDISRCTFKMVAEQSFYNISVVVRNALGEERQSYAFNISDRVFPVAEDVSVLAGVTDAEVSWALSGNFSSLQFSCRIRLESAGGQRELQVKVPEWERRVTEHVKHLQPSCQYSITLCCHLLENSCRYTTKPTHFTTDPLVTLSVWRRIERRAHNRSIAVLWKTFNSGSDSNVQVFEVCVKQKDALKSVCENVTKTQVDLTVGAGVYHVSVRAVTLVGLSEPAHITVPSDHPVSKLVEKRIMGDAEGFLLSWSSLSSATGGYIVDWCRRGSATPCDLQWSKVPANQTSLFLTADGFQKGCRYTFRIFSCHSEGDLVHEKQIGYLEEQKPVQFPELEFPPSVSWTSVKLEWSFNEEDPAHPGFITGYMITVHNDSQWNSTHNVWSLSVQMPDCKSLEVAGLQESQQYTICLAACTCVGCGPVTTLTITTLQNRYLLLAKVLTPLLVVMGCFLCFWPCRKTLTGIAVDVFKFPSDHTMKVLELDGNLYEVSENLRALQVEDCKCCELEIMEAPSTVAEKSCLLFTDSSWKQKDLSVLAAPPLTENRPTPVGWAAAENAPPCREPGGETMTSMVNLTYLSSLPCPEDPEGAPPYHTSQEAGPSSDGYVTSITMVTRCDSG